MMTITWRSPIRLATLTLAVMVLAALGVIVRRAALAVPPQQSEAVAGPFGIMPNQRALLGVFNNCPGPVGVLLSFRDAVTGQLRGQSDSLLGAGQGAFAALDGFGLGPAPVQLIAIIQSRANGGCEPGSGTVQLADLDSNGKAVAITSIIPVVPVTVEFAQ